MVKEAIGIALWRATTRLGIDREALNRLARVHKRLWSLEDRARSRTSPDSTIAAVKRSIDRLNGIRHSVIDRIDDSVHGWPRRDGAVLYSETLGELADRLIILQLKVENAWSLARDRDLTESARSRCARRARGFEQWRRHLRAVLTQQLADTMAGRAGLPPRAEFKMYNERDLNPVTRAEARAQWARSGPRR